MFADSTYSETLQSCDSMGQVLCLPILSTSPAIMGHLFLQHSKAETKAPARLRQADGGREAETGAAAH